MNRAARYLELAKPRILSMVLVTTALGFLLGGHGVHALRHFLLALTGVGCATGGASILNNYLERKSDAMMKRTCNRALPARLIEPTRVLAVGVSFLLIGVFLLSLGVNLLTAFLVLLTAFLYVLVYTPLKRVSWLSTTFGAIPGATR